MVNPTYEKGIETKDFVTGTSADYDMLYKVALQILRGVNAEDRLLSFDKGSIDNGETIEQVVVQLAESSAYDKTAVDCFTKKDPKLAVRYFKEWTHKVFETSTNDNEMRKVMLRDGSVNALAETIVSSLSEGDIYERYINTRDLLAYGKQSGDGKVFINSGSVSKVAYKDILVKLKDIVAGMQFVNSDFNMAGIKRKTINEDIRIIMPYTIKNKIDVEELAGVFNLDKAELKSKIIETDGADDTIYIVDVNAVQLYTRLYEMRSIYNPKALYMNYFLHTDRMYALSPLFDGCYIELTE